MNETIFFTIWFIVMISIVSIFFLLGKRSLQIFPDPSTVQILYEEMGTSGRANDSIITKAGGATGVLHVVLTTEELWIKTGLFFAGIAKIYKLLNKIPRDRIVSVNKLNKRNVKVSFKEEKGNIRSVTIKLRDPDQFIQLLSV